MKKALLIALLTLPAQTNAWPFEDPPFAWIGADAEIPWNNHGAPTFCNGTAIDTANIGLGQVLHRNKRSELVAHWTHHSCISQAHDRNAYDGIGIYIKFSLW